jgi:hypothetical protein
MAKQVFSDGKTPSADLGTLKVLNAELVPAVLVRTTVGIFRVNAHSEISVGVYGGDTTFVPLANSDTILEPEEQVAVILASLDIFEKLPTKYSSEPKFQTTFVSMA